MDFDVKTENFEKTRLSIVKLAVWLVYNAFLILYNGYRMMLGSKDAIRIVPYFVLPQFYPIFAYREAYAPLLCSYRGGSLSHKTTLVQAHRGFRLLTLASLYSIRNDANESLCYRKSNSFRLGITKIYLLFYHKTVNFANKKTINNGYGMYKKSIAGK